MPADADRQAPIAVPPASPLSEEDKLVAELARLGVTYLSRPQSRADAFPLRPPHQLLADIVRQPSSRVRIALIPLLLANPGYADSSRAALELLRPQERWLFKLLYTAAVFLQPEYAEALGRYRRGTRPWLPDLFSAELGVAPYAPAQALRALARIHAQTTGANLNWHGTYHHAVQQLLHRWDREAQWHRSRPT